MVREVEGPEELSAQRRRGGLAVRELKKLQQRVQNSLDGWLDYYHAAIGTYQLRVFEHSLSSFSEIYKMCSMSQSAPVRLFRVVQ